MYLQQGEMIMSDDTPKPVVVNTPDYSRGISSTLTFLFVLAALAAQTGLQKMICVGAACFSAGVGCAAAYFKNKKTK